MVVGGIYSASEGSAERRGGRRLKERQGALISKLQELRKVRVRERAMIKLTSNEGEEG
mgnify:CR=1 FL=1